MQEIKIVLAKLLRKFVFKGMKDYVHYGMIYFFMRQYRSQLRVSGMLTI